MIRVFSIICFFISTFSYGQTLIESAGNLGINYTQSYPSNSGNGMSFFDFDSDGWDDITLPAHNDSVVFYKNVSGSFVKIPSMLYSIGIMHQISWVDYDNDGDYDLCATFETKGVRLYQNDGNFSFTDVTALSGITTQPFQGYGFSFADPDNDGDLDFYICNYGVSSSGIDKNFFYENQGNGTFIDRSLSSGLHNGTNASFMAVWFDYDNDGDIDLHVINDRTFQADSLYRNDGNGTYTEVAIDAELDNYGHNPMSLSVSDFNNDGWFDIFKTDIANGTAYQGILNDYTFSSNMGNGIYQNNTYSMNLNYQMFAWGALFVDFDNDRYEDLYIATSYLNTTSNPAQTSLLLNNNNGLNFTNNNSSITGNIITSAFSPTKGDINNDGFYDIVVLNKDTVPTVLLNDANSINNYIKITLEGTISNREAIGATIKVWDDGICQTQTTFCGINFCAQNSQHHIFGAKNSQSIDSIIVHFPSGIVMKEFNIPTNQHITIREKVQVSVDLIPNNDTTYMCFGESVTIGTSGQFNHTWNTGSNNDSIVINSSGTYFLTAESISGDTLYISQQETIIMYDSISFQVVTDQPNCDELYGNATLLSNQIGDIDSIIWSNGVYGTLNDSLIPDIYTYIIYSNSGCQQYGSISIEAIPNFSVQYFTTTASESNGGSIEFYIWGGTPPFTYSINGIIGSNPYSDLSPGSYTATITDANGCENMVDFNILLDATASIAVNEEDQVSIRATGNNIHIKSNDEIEVNSIQLVDLLGRKIPIETVKVSSDEYILQVKVNSGIYELILELENNIVLRKIKL